MEQQVVTLDIRPVPGPQKHPTIFRRFDELQAGGRLLLINDHEPKPLYYQFAAERTGQFEWNYVERGPQVWKVEIGKKGGYGCGHQHFEKATDALRQDHRVIEKVLDALEKLIQSPAVPLETWEKAIGFIHNFADRCHHHKEETILFPSLEERGIPSEGGPIGMMLFEHEEGRAYMRGLLDALELAKEDPQAAAPALCQNAAAYLRLLRQHIQKEDQILFSMADDSLSAADQKTLLNAFEKHEQEEMGSGTHAKYLKIAEELGESGREEKMEQEINLLAHPHGQCHERVMRGLDAIGTGDSALIIADHDAKPVLYQYQAEHGHALSWEYKEEGPDVWKIRVTKRNGPEQPQRSTMVEFDVRAMPPPQRHKTIFEKFDRLRSGEGFILVNDHDPKPLYYELRSVRGEVLTWDYLEAGPKVWRVKILKTKDVDVGAEDAGLKFDVRKIPPPDRHPSIFHRFGTLSAGESIEVVNDHDPRPLYFHFQQVFGDAFSWEYLEQGPALWRVKITKKNSAPAKGAQTTLSADAPELDVRKYTPAVRHKLIFETYEALEPGDAFILVNDHDPKPLYYQFEAEMKGRFRWEYLQKGPEEWKVLIGKTE